MPCAEECCMWIKNVLLPKNGYDPIESLPIIESLNGLCSKSMSSIKSTWKVAINEEINEVSPSPESLVSRLYAEHESLFVTDQKITFADEINYRRRCFALICMYTAVVLKRHPVKLAGCDYWLYTNCYLQKFEALSKEAQKGVVSKYELYIRPRPNELPLINAVTELQLPA
ncbi:hypothetical protein DFJ73DRAFT_861065 [Zopfochytrium polystomum]|nr:hypothetical protein DFJ73DRAFT_861065 [Zopfochytrium polystomum]